MMQQFNINIEGVVEVDKGFDAQNFLQQTIEKTDLKVIEGSISMESYGLKEPKPWEMMPSFKVERKLIQDTLLNDLKELIKTWVRMGELRFASRLYYVIKEYHSLGIEVDDDDM